MESTDKTCRVMTAGLVVLFCIALSAYALQEDAGESVDRMPARVAGIFARSDELEADRGRRCRQYVTSLDDADLAKLYARAMAPQRQEQDSREGLQIEWALKKVRAERSKVIDELVDTGVLSEEDEKAFRAASAGLADELAALGPQAAPAIVPRLGSDHRMTSDWHLAREALKKMGPSVTEHLIPFVAEADRFLREKVFEVICAVKGPPAKGLFLDALDDESGLVRRYAVQGLVDLGPDQVGQERLVKILIDHLDDSYGWAMWTAIDGLRRYGDTAAIEPLEIIEKFHPNRGKGDMRFHAARAIREIRRRAGETVEEVSWDQYDTSGPDYEQLVLAAQCPNATIRASALGWLDRYRDPATARFLIGRIDLEPNHRVLDEIGRSLHTLMMPPKGTSEMVVTPDLIRKAFTGFVSRAENSESAAVELAAISGARSTLYAASYSILPLEGIDRFKSVVRKGLASDDQTMRVTCCMAATSIAAVNPQTAATWSDAERNELQKHLGPRLDSANPEIRLIECLGYVGDGKLVPRLIELLEHSESSVRRFAAHALGRIGNQEALPALRHLAQTDPTQYSNGVYGVRVAARGAIEAITGVPFDGDDREIKMRLNRNMD